MATSTNHHAPYSPAYAHPPPPLGESILGGQLDGCVYVQASENLHWVEMYTDSLNGTNVVEIVKEKGSATGVFRVENLFMAEY
ncbi:hypothetical protein OUZ56_022130 [Daphnia magna]|uniref:Uncharacterized protein n=1 Tax=Daphnia magna TaxID=35525 RepID=A0ABR0AVE1_9CRUS|nr:hypothetical protein OUZ56_022130 [Daphnia magna]